MEKSSRPLLWRQKWWPGNRRTPPQHCSPISLSYSCISSSACLSPLPDYRGHNTAILPIHNILLQCCDIHEICDHCEIVVLMNKCYGVDGIEEKSNYHDKYLPLYLIACTFSRNAARVEGKNAFSDSQRY
jgi:hypothetical protein